MMRTALGGGNLLHDVGYIESGMTACYEHLVAMNEVAGLVKRFMNGVEISPETIGLDIIDKIGSGIHNPCDDVFVELTNIASFDILPCIQARFIILI